MGVYILLPPHNRDDSRDELINEDETGLAIKYKRTPGIDGIPPEKFRLFDKQLLLTLLNRILTDQLFPESWSVGIIKPIYKSGNRQDPSITEG